MNPTRRSLLRRSALAFPAIAGLNPAVNARAAREGKLGVALCGLGGFSTRSIAPELPSAGHVYLAGVITGDPEKKGRQWAAQYGFPENHIFTYDTMEAMTECADIDIVHVVTPNSLHAKHSIAAARAGKHVMCEKPMATSSADCQAMIDACVQADVRLGVSYRLQFEPHHVKAIELLANDAVGELCNGTYEFSWGYARGLTGPNKDGIKKWLLDPAMAGGGALFDTGVYPIQAALSLSGKLPVAVRGMPATLHPHLFPQGIEETMSFELRFADGFQALGRASYSQNFHQCTTLGPNGVVEILPGQPRGSVFGQSGGGNPNPKRLVANGREIECEDTLQLGVLLDEFARSITQGTPFRAPGEMGLRDLRLLEAIYASARRGGEVVEVAA